MSRREINRSRVVIGSALASTGLHVANSVFAWGWPAATGLALALIALYSWHAVTQRDGLVARLALAGLAAGLMILLSDWYCITYGGLRYERGGPFLFLSPLYIPLSFTGAMVQLGYLSDSVDRRYGLAKAAALTAALGTFYVPLYELLAKEGRLWHYQGVSMILGTVPYYIIFGELLLSVGASLLTRWIAGRALGWAALGGALFGAWIGGSMAFGGTLFP